MPTAESGDANAPALQSLTHLLTMNDTPENTLSVSERVFEALRVRLSSLLGASGYAALLARSIAVTRRDHSVLASVTADRNGSLVGRFDTLAESNRAAMTDAFATVLTQFVALLDVFIGAGLSERLISAVWQDLQSNVSNDTDGAGIG